MIVRKQITLSKTEINHWVYLLLVEMGHHALAHGSTSLGWGAMAQGEWRWRRGSVGGLRGKCFSRHPWEA